MTAPLIELDVAFTSGVQKAVWEAADAVKAEPADWVCAMHVERAVVDVLLQMVDRLGSDAVPAMIAHRDGSVRLTADAAADMVFLAARTSEEHALAGERLRGERAIEDVLQKVQHAVAAMGLVLPWVGVAPAPPSLEDLVFARPTGKDRIHSALEGLRVVLTDLQKAINEVPRG